MELVGQVFCFYPIHFLSGFTYEKDKIYMSEMRRGVNHGKRTYHMIKSRERGARLTSKCAMYNQVNDDGNFIS